MRGFTRDDISDDGVLLERTANALEHILKDRNLGHTLRQIPGGREAAFAPQNDSAFLERLKTRTTTVEDTDKYVLPLLTALEIFITPPGYNPHPDYSLHRLMGVFVDRLDDVSFERSENFYKFRDDVATFEEWRNSRLCQDKATNVIDLDTFETLEMHAIAYRSQLEKLREDRQEFRREMKAGAREPHTVIYEGPEGKVVVPHTVGACQYHGNFTSWCIAARGEDNMFEHYNGRAPIFIFTPAESAITSEERQAFPQYKNFKFAITEGVAYDENDKQKMPQPPSLGRLREAALASLKGGKRDYFELFSDDDDVHWQRDSNYEYGSFPEIPPEYPAEWKRELEYLFAEEEGDISPELRKDSRFMLLAIQMNANNFEKASKTLRGFSLFQRQAVLRNPAVFDILIERKNFNPRQFCKDMMQAEGTKGALAIARSIHLIPEFYGGPLTMNADEILSHLEGKLSIGQPRPDRMGYNPDI